MAQVGLNELHYALLTEDTQEAISYGEVKPLSGAINATINPTVNTQELYADDQLWESVSALGKIDVEVETAQLPLNLRAELLGNELKNGVLIEKANDSAPHLALGFKSLKSNGSYRYIWLLKGVAQPIAEDYSTKRDNVEHKTPRLRFTFMSRIHDGQWKHTADEDSEEFSGEESWFEQVPVPVDKSALTALITSAQELLDGAVIGTDPGEYPQGDYDTFSDALDVAQGVADDEEADQETVDAAVVTLDEAMTAFLEAEVE